MDHRPRIFCPAAGVPSKDRTDITRGTLQALRHIKARARLLPNFYPERPGSILFRSVETFILGHSLTHWFPSPAPTSLLTRFASPDPFHVHPMSASSMRGTRTSSSSSRSSRLAVADYADHPCQISGSGMHGTSSRTPCPPLLLSVRCRALSSRRCLIT